MFSNMFMMGTTTGGNQYSSLIIIVAMIAVFYFLLIRPQQKKSKQVRDMLNALEVGQRVRTIGGLYGTIVDFKEDGDIVVIEVGYENKVKMAFAKTAVAQVNDEGAEADSVDDSSNKK